MGRRASKIDDNQPEIVEALEKIGCKVSSLAGVGGGVPDLLVGLAGKNYLLEVKDGAKPPSARKLTPDQVIFHDGWRGQVDIVTSAEQAIDVVTRGY